MWLQIRPGGRGRSGSSSFLVRCKLEMLHTGDEFDTFNDLRDTILAYEQAEYVQLYVQRSRSIESALKRTPKKVFKENLVYTEVKYACIHGGKKFNTTSTGARPNQK